jgi:hypothetical protein
MLVVLLLQVAQLQLQEQVLVQVPEQPQVLVQTPLQLHLGSIA